MTAPAASAIFAASEATWPAAAITVVGPFTIRDGHGGGSRVSAATVTPGADGDAIDAVLPEAIGAMQALGQRPLFQIREGDDALDARLAGRGFAILDPVIAYVGTCASLAAEPLEMLKTFRIWPPVAAQREIWAAAGIGAARLAIMGRAAGPKISLLGRSSDTPAATAFVACDGPLAMLHALETAPEMRRQGIARHIMRAAGHWAIACGAHHLAVLVTRENIAGNALYRSLGMVPVTGYHYRIAPPG